MTIESHEKVKAFLKIVREEEHPHLAINVPSDGDDWSGVHPGDQLSVNVDRVYVMQNPNELFEEESATSEEEDVGIEAVVTIERSGVGEVDSVFVAGRGIDGLQSIIDILLRV